MKSTILFLMILCANLGAQSDVQFIKIKNSDRSVDLSVVNHSENDVIIDVKLELENMKSSIDPPIKISVKAYEKRSITKLVPITPDRTNFLVSYKVVTSSPTFVYEPNINIYTKNKNKRSTQLLIYLEEHGIAYNEINISYNGDTKKMYQKMLERRNLTKKDARIPVVIYKGEAFTNIQKVPKWCDTHLSNEGHFIKKRDRKY